MPLPTLARLSLLAASLVPAARAVEVSIQFGALERVLAETVFTQDGRKYVHGTAADKCNFAYLERPRIESAAGRLRIRARFTGRSALDMFGKCVGLGDAFGVVILATPQYHDGFVTLTAVTVTGDGKTGYYIRRVCAAMAASLGHDFRYPLAIEFQQALQNPGILPAYPRALKDFRVPEVRVTDDALVFFIDFQITVK
ncbi:MAG TPA: hypothetical protein VKF41_01280 [Bryobacteraceae bacterium]|nr:hypothetical protein [Bryobacteraceae bacterium]